ncbi:hypothetical protein AAG565_11000 [Fontimonas sp. SYSU GA230001]|uniref:hypothetical protein n=1 Tax=Fontimonas sp. SYSU GA230001 TaxID=3142450 RepID=UPI0032B36C74
MQDGTFLLFSGYNDRAVIALCRFFHSQHLPFAIVAADHNDSIFKTSWKSNVILTRDDRLIDLRLFTRIRNVATELGIRSLIYCPTTEFSNVFVLAHRQDLQTMGWHIPMPSESLYLLLSNKATSHALIHQVCGIHPPPHLNWHEAASPCVFKPKTNVGDERVNYPLICLSESEVLRAKSVLNPDNWFAQTYIKGQSHYLCGYLARDGRRSYFWQLNLLQQSGGKSIVLARTGHNPGLDEEALFDRLSSVGYFGPWMMELLQDSSGTLHFVEVNPRFWGPLQLAVDVCPRILHLFSSDSGHSTDDFHCDTSSIYWYAWAHGRRAATCMYFPAADSLTAPEIDELIAQHDVYGREDTAALHGKH